MCEKWVNTKESSPPVDRSIVLDINSMLHQSELLAFRLPIKCLIGVLCVPSANTDLQACINTDFNTDTNTDADVKSSILA